MLEAMCKSMRQVLEVPLTLKMRTAIYQGKNVAHNLIPKAVTWGVDAITVSLFTVLDLIFSDVDESGFVSLAQEQFFFIPLFACSFMADLGSRDTQN